MVDKMSSLIQKVTQGAGDKKVVAETDKKKLASRVRFLRNAYVHHMRLVLLHKVEENPFGDAKPREDNLLVRVGQTSDIKKPGRVNPFGEAKPREENLAAKVMSFGQTKPGEENPLERIPSSDWKTRNLGYFACDMPTV
ncbi:hypothetical protein RHMOL_Rhmol09G0038700 [Rhododendron molle]|uniref:Uncharacterized protein n=1 Tax=Rhododendron molle TaxID=49168 RepID=A0ACC0M9F3_RHOML|nr:hypothetical protein RHMOL_Rhmol09G0038700 [Rhododendron molle]